MTFHKLYGNLNGQLCSSLIIPSCRPFRAISEQTPTEGHGDLTHINGDKSIKRFKYEKRRQSYCGHVSGIFVLLYDMAIVG